MNAVTLIRERRTVRLGAVMIIAFFLLLLSVSCTAAISQSSGQPSPTTIEQQVASATPLPAATDKEGSIPMDTAEAPAPTDTVEASVPAAWLTHNNEHCEYAISYPSDMQVSDQDMGSQQLAFDLDDPEVGLPNFIYICH